MVSTLGLLVSCTSSPALPPLLVVTDDNAVTAISPEGETVELVAADPDRLVSQATWAPDGRLAVWTEVDTTAGACRHRDGRFPGTEKDRRRDDSVSSTPGAPTGTHVAYLGNSPDGAGVAMGIVDVAAGTARLVDSGAPYYLDWAPDGSRLAVHVDSTFLGFVDLDGNRTPLTTASRVASRHRNSSTTAACWSPPAATSQGVAMSEESGEPVLIAPTDGGTFFSASSERSIARLHRHGRCSDPRITRRDSDRGAPVTAKPADRQRRSPWSRSSGRRPVEQLLFLTVNAEGTALIPQVWEAGSVADLRGAGPHPGDDQPVPSVLGSIQPGPHPVVTGWRQLRSSGGRRERRQHRGVRRRERRHHRVSGGRFASWAPEFLDPLPDRPSDRVVAVRVPASVSDDHTRNPLDPSTGGSARDRPAAGGWWCR